MNLIRDKFRKHILIIGMFFFIFVSHAQERSIYIEHLGPQDRAMIPIWIPRDTNNVDFEHISARMVEYAGVLGFSYPSPQDFDLLECVLKKELYKNKKNKGLEYFGNFRIVFFDESLKIIVERYICCDLEAAKTFKKLMKLKSVSSNKFISGLLLEYISFIEENQIVR